MVASSSAKKSLSPVRKPKASKPKLPPLRSKAPAGTLMSHGDLAELYTQCIKLASANKINEKNTWSLQLIDVMQDVLDDPNEQGNNRDAQILNFQRASCTLDASVMIYSKRVDSVHKDTFKVLGGLSNTELGQEESGVKSKSSSAGRRAGGATLEKKPESISVTRLEQEFDVDPLFQKTSASFDEGGARGLLLNTLRVYNGYSLAFDGDGVENLAPMQPSSSMKKASSPESTPLEMKSLAGQLWQASRFPTNQIAEALSDLRVCDSLDSLTELAERLEADPSFETENTEPPVLEGWDTTFSPDDDDYFGPNHTTVVDSQRHDSVFEHGDGDFLGGLLEDLSGFDVGATTDDTFGSQDQTMLDSDSRRQHQGVVFSSQVIAQLPEADRWSTANWSGAGHWKFGLQQTDPKKTGKLSKRSKRERIYIDFLTDENAVVEAVAFAVAPRSNQTLSQAALRKTYAADHSLPDDLKFNISRFQSTFLKPNVSIKLSRRLRSGSSAQRKAATSGENLMMASTAVGLPSLEQDLAYGYDDDGMEGGFEVDGGDIDALAEELGGLQMVEPPKTVRRMDISYSRVSKQVNVRQLKQDIWTSICESAGRTPAEEGGDSDGLSGSVETSGRAVSFQATIDSLEERMSGRALEAVSVPFCFISILHLCNEKGLELVQDHSLAPQDVQNAADAGFNFGDFSVVCPTSS